MSDAPNSARPDPARPDRLPSPRLDSRMPREGRARAPEPAPEWRVRGELFLNCSCEVFCPCVVSLGRAPPTEGSCRTWMAVAVDEGRYGEADLSGLGVGILGEIPGRMADGNWTVALYVDERASDAAFDGLAAILSGRAGGSTGLLGLLVSTVLGAERAPVEIVRDGRRRSIRVGRKIEGEIEAIEGAEPDRPVTVSNSRYWMGPEIVVARGLRSRLRDHGRMWDFGGRSAEICPIDWRGPGR